MTVGFLLLSTVQEIANTYRAGRGWSSINGVQVAAGASGTSVANKITTRDMNMHVFAQIASRDC